MKVNEVQVDSVIPYPNNPRVNDQAVQGVADSIRAFGWQQPIVVDKNNVVIVGHTRLKAAKLLGMETVPVLVADNLTPDEVAAYRLADNKTAEAAIWDQGKLAIELKGIELDMSPWFDKQDMSWAQDSEEYAEWLSKFDQPKTTDDCYTPANVYDAVAGWVSDEYGIRREDMVRPFYPGGDYQAEEYTEGCCVVDNPPFSILSEIIRFYIEQGVRFFLFAPALTLFSSSSSSCAAIALNVGVTYENGATVSTSFVTNLDDCRIRAAPELYKLIDGQNDLNLAAMHADLPKYEYPVEVATASRLGYLSKYGQDFRVMPGDCVRITGLDSQTEQGKAIYGSGYLLSEKAAAEKAAAEKAAAEKWTLSERERDIVRSLGKA